MAEKKKRSRFKPGTPAKVGEATPLSGPSKASRFSLTKKKTGSPRTAGPGSKAEKFTVKRPNETTKTFPNTPGGKKAAIDLLSKGGSKSKPATKKADYRLGDYQANVHKRVLARRAKKAR